MARSRIEPESSGFKLNTLPIMLSIPNFDTYGEANLKRWYTYPYPIYLIYVFSAWLMGACLQGKWYNTYVFMPGILFYTIGDVLY